MSQKDKIPVTIITGFLGAGKTTFINKLLQNYTNTQFALVENEFGDVAIDTKLIKGIDASQMFELKQGCICCTITDEFELVLQELAERFPNVEHLLIETTGVADPAAVIQPFFRDENLKKIYSYNGTICLFDALNFEMQLEKDIKIKQLVTADLVLISKAAKHTKKQLEDLQKKIGTVNPFAKICTADLEKADELELDNLIRRVYSEFNFVFHKTQHSQIKTITLSSLMPLNKDEFIRWLDYTLDIYKNEIYRTKGILCFENEPYEYLVQGVGGNFEITEGDLILGTKKSELVIIGKLDHLDIKLP